MLQTNNTGVHSQTHTDTHRHRHAHTQVCRARQGNSERFSRFPRKGPVAWRWPQNLDRHGEARMQAARPVSIQAWAVLRL